MTAHDERDVETVAEAICASRHGDLGIVPMPGDPDPRMRSAACFGCQRDARAVLAALDVPGRERRAKAEALREFADTITVQTAARIVEDLLARAAELDPEGADR